MYFSSSTVWSSEHVVVEQIMKESGLGMERTILGWNRSRDRMAKYYYPVITPVVVHDALRS